MKRMETLKIFKSPLEKAGKAGIVFCLIWNVYRPVEICNKCNFLYSKNDEEVKCSYPVFLEKENETP